MKIENNLSTAEFISDVMRSVSNNSDLRNLMQPYMNVHLSKKKEKQVIDCYNYHGVVVDSIEYDVNELVENPYYKNIKLDNIKSNTVQYKNKVLPARTSLNMSYLKYADELYNGYVDVGYFNKDVNVPILYEHEKIWMSPTIAEARSMKDDIDKAHGNVLTFGLGIGYYAYMCLLKDEVDSVTIIEINQEVIELFKEYILPQFNTNKRIEIIQGDMYEYYNEKFLDTFDYIFVDVWEDNNFGLEHYKKLMQKGIKKGNIGYWIEDSILEPIRILMPIYFKSLMEGKYTDVLCSMTGKTQEEFKMVHKYFRGIDKTITTYNEMVEIINSKEIIRGILSIKI